MLIRSKRIVIRVVTTTMLFVFGAGVMSLLGVGPLSSGSLGLGSLGSVLWGESAYADVVTEHRDNVSFSITEQCLFQGSGAASKTFSGTALNGQEIGGSTATNKFVDEDGAETNVHEFNVSCNVYTGYTVKAYATNLEHQLDFDPGNPDLILFVNDKPVTETSDSYDYLIANNDTQGYWTASVSGDDTSNTFSTNAAAPTTIKLGNTITAEDGDTFSVAYKAYVGKLTPPGSYNGEAVYILASNPTPDIPEDTVFQYNITYDANGGTGLNITSQSGTAQGSTTITPPTGLNGPDGKIFVGWSKTEGSNTIDFNAGQDIALTSSTFSSYPATLHAVYLDTMQNFTAAKCAAIATYDQESEFQLIDSRTNARYYVRHLRDNNCWMVQNLWLPGSMTLTSADSDITTGYTYTLPAASTDGYTESDTSTARMYAVSANGTYTSGTGGHIDDQHDTIADNVDDDNTGAFFSWMAATAGTGNYYGQSTLVRPVAGKSAQSSDSVCPKGWKLPTGGSGGQFDILYNYSGYNNNYYVFTAEVWPHGLVGYCRSNTCTYDKGGMDYWSSSVQYDAYRNNAFYRYGYALYPAGSNLNGKWCGISVRCVLAGSDTTNPW